MQARAAPPAEYQGAWWRVAEAVPQELLDAVVEMVRVAVPAVAPVMVTGLVELKLAVGWLPPVGPVMAAVSVTLPVKPLAGVTVMALDPPLPALTVRLDGDAERATPGVGAALTVRATVVDAVRLHGMPQETGP
jgi:hypothetical protein